MVNEEEFRLREATLLDELKAWKDKYSTLESKMEEKLSEAEKVLSRSDIPNEATVCLEAVVKELSSAKDEVSNAKVDFEDFKKEVNSWLTEVKKDIAEVKATVKKGIEEAKEENAMAVQYSKKNNAILEDFPNLPDLNPVQFIFLLLISSIIYFLP